MPILSPNLNVPAPSVSALGEQVRSTISQFVRQVRAQTSTLRDARLETLELLEAGGKTIATLARARGVKHQSMRLVIAELEAEGLVTRVDDIKDARAQHIAISAAALQEVQSARQARAAWIAQRIDNIGPEEQKALARGMSILESLLSE